MRHRNRRSKIKSIGLTVLAILLSPVVASGFVKGLSSIEAAASVLSDIKVGDSEKLNVMNITSYPFEVLSKGFGWKEENGISGAVQLNSDKGPVPYPAITEVKSGSVIRDTFGEYSGKQYFSLDNCGQVRNCTDEQNSVLLAQSRLNPEIKIELGDEPQVLIMHTHTTESFEPFERDYYDNSFSYRTTDENMNVVAVGEEIKTQIEKYGISVLHNTQIHDYPSYTGSYDRSAVTVKKVLAENPSIKIVLDIHRDAISRDGDLIAPVIEKDSKKAAQVMIISGCDDGTMNMPNYLQNFRLACRFQEQFESDTPGITRPILFDYRNYNQELTTGSLLIEVGSHGNSIEQVRYSGNLIGNSIGKVLQSLT
ncbi:MAG: stage II sporulation protein P [Oscillospiraceae bacterium]|nr:stage II sporulation protein P [Oscillospiraceae bacterium]